MLNSMSSHVLTLSVMMKLALSRCPFTGTFATDGNEHIGLNIQTNTHSFINNSQEQIHSTRFRSLSIIFHWIQSSHWDGSHFFSIWVHRSASE